MTRRQNGSDDGLGSNYGGNGGKPPKGDFWERVTAFILIAIFRDFLSSIIRLVAITVIAILIALIYPHPTPTVCSAPRTPIPDDLPTSITSTPVIAQPPETSTPAPLSEKAATPILQQVVLETELTAKAEIYKGWADVIFNSEAGIHYIIYWTPEDGDIFTFVADPAHQDHNISLDKTRGYNSSPRQFEWRASSNQPVKIVIQTVDKGKAVHARIKVIRKN